MEEKTQGNNLLLYPSFKKILQISTPVMLASLVQNLIGWTDMIFMGRVGITEFNAVGITSLFYLVFSMIGLGFSRGAQILIARRSGENNPLEIGRLSDQFSLLLGGVNIIIFLVLYFVGTSLLSLFVSDTSVAEAGGTYLGYRSWGILLGSVGYWAMALYAGVGKTRIIVWTTLVLAITNAILNYGLVFGAWGLPEMGIAGAGLASTLSELTSGLMVLLYVWNDSDRKVWKLFSYAQLSWDSIKKMLDLSFPIILQYMIGLGSWFVFFTLIEKMGEIALAVSFVMRWIYSFLSIPIHSNTSAVNTLVSNAMGQNREDLAKKSILRTIALSFSMTFLLGLTLFFIPETLTMVFTDDLEIIEEAPKWIPLLFWISLVSSVSTTVFNGIVGAGATRISFGIELFTVIIYLSYTFYVINQLGKGLGWVWMAEVVYWGLLLILSLLLIFTGRWRKSI